ncbi:hypothetical protein NL676_021843 [Syzygium grande]|nr:hypothetical protein NL676_021843 [Syzygium grande]
MGPTPGRPAERKRALDSPEMLRERRLRIVGSPPGAAVASGLAQGRHSKKLTDLAAVTTGYQEKPGKLSMTLERDERQRTCGHA